MRSLNRLALMFAVSALATAETHKPEPPAPASAKAKRPTKAEKKAAKRARRQPDYARLESELVDGPVYDDDGVGGRDE